MIRSSSTSMQVTACAMLFLSILLDDALAQQEVTYDESLYKAMKYRCIGPFRGGRSAAVTGIPGDPFTYYFGGTGGGIWKTENGGQTWENISDGHFGGSIGAVAVSESDPSVIYVGGGEKTVRGNVSHGYGVWKSLDGGTSWKSMGLKDSRHIPRIRIHPKDPDRVYAAVLGHLFGPNSERGVYRSRDGGNTWERILHVSDEAGAVDLVLHPTNPRILYATLWRVRRTPHSLESGGEGSGLWKSEDGGDSWCEITRNEGLPQGMVGIIGVAVSPVEPDRVFAVVEAEDGGVFRSEDGGEEWRKVNEERKLRQRAWYYTRIYADPKEADRVYVLNVRFWRSKDGGKTFERIPTPHSDHHDLWIAPEDPQRMIVGDDGGGQVTFNGGEQWSTYHNQPTAQFYRVTTDNHFPYRILGAQQDNSTVRILHRSSSRGITERHWEETAGGESGWLAPHPENPDIVYGGSYSGFLTRMNHETGAVRAVNVWPDDPLGHGAMDMKYRFQWNFPILFSPHDPGLLYAAGNLLFKSTDEGQSWQAISSDLTRNDPAKLGPSGGPITKDNTGVETYATLFALAESPHEAGVLWAGSDDGLIHLSRDGGQSWKNVTPLKDLMPEWIQINTLETHPFEPGGLYVAATRYKSDDFRPYLYKTEDYGAHWEKITHGIDEAHFTRVVRADPKRRGLLYGGTESGMYLSFDDGASWRSMQLNLPVVPVTDLAVKNDDLVVATQGRAFWVLDDLTPLHQLSEEVARSAFWLFEPRPAYRLRGGRRPDSKTEGENPPNGVLIHYVLKEAQDVEALTLEILEHDGEVIKTFRPKAAEGEDKKSKEEEDRRGEEKDSPLPKGAGLNRFVWNMRYPSAEKFEGLILWAGDTMGPKAVPGTYQVRLTAGNASTTVPFEILKDPRSSATMEDFKAQFDFLIQVRDKLTAAHRVVKRIRKVREQVEDLMARIRERDGAEPVRKTGETLVEKITGIEKTLYQTQNQSRQDPLNFPIRLNNKLATLGNLMAMGDDRPTDQAYGVLEDLTLKIDRAIEAFKKAMEKDLPAFNRIVREQDIPAIILEESDG